MDIEDFKRGLEWALSSASRTTERRQERTAAYVQPPLLELRAEILHHSDYPWDEKATFIKRVRSYNAFEAGLVFQRAVADIKCVVVGDIVVKVLDHGKS